MKIPFLGETSKLDLAHHLSHCFHYSIHITYLTLVFSTAHSAYGIAAGGLAVATILGSLLDLKYNKRKHKYRN